MLLGISGVKDAMISKLAEKLYTQKTIEWHKK